MNRLLVAALLTVTVIGGGMALWSFVTPAISSRGQARGRATAATMRTIETALKGYKSDKGSYPANLQVLVTSKFLEDRIKDAWNHDIEYRTPGLNGKNYSLVSPGPDGQLGTDDDIDIWKLDNTAE